MSEDNKRKNSPSGFLYSDLSFGAKEAFKRLRANVLCSFEDESSHIVGITSAQPSEGKSLISINFSYCVSELNKKVILIDCDLYRPSVNDKLNIKNNVGLSDILAGTVEIPDAIHRIKDKSGTVCIDVITSGTPCDNPSELLNSRRLTNLILGLKKYYDYVMLDMSPIGAISDAAPLSKNTDGVIVVVREGHCPQKVLQSCIDQLKLAKTKILGFAVNGSMEGTGKKYTYHSNNYGYGYSYYNN